jgi:hypothetical protein
MRSHFYDSACRSRWLDHLKTDRYLSIAAFRQLYGEVLWGATITSIRYFAAVVWESAKSALVHRKQFKAESKRRSDEPHLGCMGPRVTTGKW